MSTKKPENGATYLTSNIEQAQIVKVDIYLSSSFETVEKCSILVKFKEGENFKRRNTLGILRIEI